MGIVALCAIIWTVIMLFGVVAFVAYKMGGDRQYTNTSISLLQQNIQDVAESLNALSDFVHTQSFGEHKCVDNNNSNNNNDNESQSCVGFQTNPSIDIESTEE